MVISRTPYRVSFFGGGTDYPEWFLNEGGAVLSSSIDKYCYIHCRYQPPYYETMHSILWSQIETVKRISEIKHPAVREGLRMLGFDDNIGVEIIHQGDLPAGSGMGSSSAFAVGLLKALIALKGQMIDKRELAFKAIELERERLKETVGVQDQMAASFGGLNYITFERNGSIRVDPVTISGERISSFQSRLLLLYMGKSRESSLIAKSVISNIPAKKSIFRAIKDTVEESLRILTNERRNIDDIGRLLNEAWMLKKETANEISNPVIDGIYSQAIQLGALGGKLLGAGKTGFLLLYVPVDVQEKIKSFFSEKMVFPFHFEFEGSTIIYYRGGMQ